MDLPSDIQARLAAEGPVVLVGDDVGAVLLAADGLMREREGTSERVLSADDPAAVAYLTLGAARHPWLRPLLPERPEDARRCPSCRGNAVAEGIPCTVCDGLGWVTAEGRPATLTPAPARRTEVPRGVPTEPDANPFAAPDVPDDPVVVEVERAIAVEHGTLVGLRRLGWVMVIVGSLHMLLNGLVALLAAWLLRHYSHELDTYTTVGVAANTVLGWMYVGFAAGIVWFGIKSIGHAGFALERDGVPLYPRRLWAYPLATPAIGVLVFLPGAIVLNPCHLVSAGISVAVLLATAWLVLGDEALLG